MSGSASRVLVVGGGAAGLLHAQLLLDRAADAGRDVEVVWAVHADGAGTASRSGGLALRYASPDPRAVGWAAASPAVAARLAARHDVLRPWLGRTRALLVSRRAPVTGYAADPVDPARFGLPHAHGALHEPGPLWHTCGLLPRWATALAADPRVRRVELAERLRGADDLVDLHDAHDADVTIACLGLGAHVLGDRRVGARLGVLVTGPLPDGVHRDHALVDDDEAAYPRYTVPHAAPGAVPGLTPTDDHLHVGGTYLPVTDAAAWDDPALLADVAEAEVPGILAAARERFPALADWEPWSHRPWWGLRPVRDEVAVGRLDRATVGGRTVVVDHGWGGSGWTIGPALADEVAAAVLADVGSLPVWRP